ncbi:hypothetical protein B0H17DRAFT_401316 [Mycena rosella]|uniref:F-box domain-containing protein n=1 Tax=Mycena rosella TaxID=1033263 RepID=A0AAD7GMV0_MYCRO|nr:hypothetical protein B0H17DRAFT_401316 [Mycena rosella]
MPCHSSMDMFDIDQDIVMESVEERQAREARTRENDLAPIARLPPEILADIFVRCVPISIPTLHSDLSWLNVTRVTSRWRNVALACPDFWSTLVFSRPKWTPVMLARSKMAALVIRVDLRKEHANSPEPILINNAARLGTLDIRAPQRYLTTFVSNLEQADAAPGLHAIKIVNTDTDNLGEGGMWLPRDLFRRTEVVESRKAGAWSGTRLHLECCAFPWDSGWYTHLTHLHLENINPTQRPTMEGFLAILVASPALQELTVIHCSPTTRHGFAVDLPHLTSLTIKSDSSSTCARLLGYLVIPPSASVHASCNLKTTHDTRHAMYQSLIPEFSDVAPSTYDTVRIVHQAGLTYTLLDSGRPEWSRNLRVDATSWPTNNVLRVTETIIEHLDFSNVTTLHLGAPGLLPDANTLALWDTMGRALRRVRTLHLLGPPAAWLEFMLTQAMLLVGVSHFNSCFSLNFKPTAAPRFRGTDGALTHAWPALQRLVLHGFDLGECGTEQLLPSSAEMLRALLWARREGRAPIWQLEIEDCENVFSQDLRHFRLFSEVVFDGKGHQTVEKEEDSDSLRSYSINVFANTVEHARKLYL